MKAKPKAVKCNGALMTKVEEVLGHQDREYKKRAVKDNRGDKSGVDVKVRVVGMGRGVCRSVCRPTAYLPRPDPTTRPPLLLLPNPTVEV